MHEEKSIEYTWPGMSPVTAEYPLCALVAGALRLVDNPLSVKLFLPLCMIGHIVLVCQEDVPHTPQGLQGSK